MGVITRSMEPTQEQTVSRRSPLHRSRQFKPASVSRSTRSWRLT